MLYIFLLLVLGIVGFLVKTFVIDGKKKDLDTLKSEIFLLLENIKKKIGNFGPAKNNISPKWVNSTTSGNLHKEDFWQKEIKSKKLYQLFQELLTSLKSGNTQAVALKIKDHVTQYKSYIWSNQIMIAQELITMVLHYQKNPKDPKVTAQNIKIIMRTLKDTIIAETNFTAETFEKVKIK
jgi:hypothetical protein